VNRREYLAKRKEIEAECRRNLDILDQAFKLFGGTPVASKNGSIPIDASAQDTPWGHDIAKKDAIRIAVKQIPGNFSLKDVEHQVHAKYGNGIGYNQLSSVLSKMAAKDELTVVKRKIGKSPAVYANKAS
jgi:hypothetical protein